MKHQTDSNALLLGAVAGAATVGATCMWAYQKWTKNKQENSFNIPSQLLNSPYKEQFQLAVKVAILAGNNIALYGNAKGTQAEASNDDLGIETKASAADFCTKIDVLNEEIVTAAIQTTFPDHAIIGEESTGTGTIPPLTDKPTWIIDPIDGTTNFASGLPLACVSIAFCVNKRPVMGCVFAPMTNELYLAAKGFGAYRNGVRITQRQHVDLQQAVVAFEFGYPRNKQAVDNMVAAVAQFMERGCRATRQIGSGVLDLCWVATGRFSLIYSGIAGEGWKPWDYAAGLVIAQEAGCAMENFQPNNSDGVFDLYGDSIICAISKELLEECRQIVTKI
ncbi:Inositol monophosphatase [Seminavis robusta]|uniref:Inositol-1-monophosphatase n=1 Tax=Seminavis robusta TaxID=568900 RepID=A0A9N8DP90_9STRA|nr:Inositol monophosphatase [Seminavis robusta]|eukprot:Sro273_g105010.1 Inositol monophosphatase (335) ;mRNA; f:5335-6484